MLSTVAPHESPEDTRQGTLARRALAGLRIYVGLIFLLAVVPKLRGDFAPRLNGFLSHVGLVEGHPFYQTFLTTTVLPHLGLVAWLVKAGELLAAFSLICGLATRLGALLALVLTLNYMFAKGAWPWQPSSNDAAFAAIALVLIIARAGRTFGLDRHRSMCRSGARPAGVTTAPLDPAWSAS
jgi:uncharacterized membrane protein YphA (DoxX/SURF4 family)